MSKMPFHELPPKEVTVKELYQLAEEFQRKVHIYWSQNRFDPESMNFTPKDPMNFQSPVFASTDQRYKPGGCRYKPESQHSAQSKFQFPPSKQYLRNTRPLGTASKYSAQSRLCPRYQAPTTTSADTPTQANTSIPAITFTSTPMDTHTLPLTPADTLTQPLTSADTSTHVLSPADTLSTVSKLADTLTPASTPAYTLTPLSSLSPTNTSVNTPTNTSLSPVDTKLSPADTGLTQYSTVL